MTFDKTRAYSMLNADEAPIGSRGYFASTVSSLRNIVENEIASCYSTLDCVEDECCFNRFVTGELNYKLFYLVEDSNDRD